MESPLINLSNAIPAQKKIQEKGGM